MDERLALSARWDLGYYLFQMQDYAAAATEFEKIRAVLPGEATLLALIGSCYSMSGRWKEGEVNLLKARKRNPADADVNGLLGQFYLSQGKGLKGAFYLEHALKAAPELVDLRANLADVYLEAGQPARARLHLETMLNERGGADFGEPRLDHAYARCLVQAGSFREALPFALRAHQAQPSQSRLFPDLGPLPAWACEPLRRGRAHAFRRARRDLAAAMRSSTCSSAKPCSRIAAGKRPRMPGWPASPGFPGHPTRSTHGWWTITSAPPVPIRPLRVVAFAERRNPDHPGNLLLMVRIVIASWGITPRPARP